MGAAAKQATCLTPWRAPRSLRQPFQEMVRQESGGLRAWTAANFMRREAGPLRNLRRFRSHPWSMRVLSRFPASAASVSIPRRGESRSGSRTELPSKPKPPKAAGAPLEIGTLR